MTMKGWAVAVVLGGLAGVAVAQPDAADREAGAVARPDAADREAVVAVVQRFFDSIASRDRAQAKAMLVDGGRFVYVVRDLGEPVVHSSTMDEFLQWMPTSKQRQLERMWNPEVKLHGDIAVLWAPYDYYRDGTFSHCGIDSFDLVKTSAGWQIAGAIYTVERSECPPSPLGAPKQSDGDCPVADP